MNKILDNGDLEFIDKNGKTVLKGVFTMFSPASYPGRIYGKYDWDFKKEKWVLNKQFCKEHNIKINKS